MYSNRLNPEQVSMYHREGYLILRKFCSLEEIDKLNRLAKGDEAIVENALDLNDQSGKKTRLSLWYTPGDDSFGYLSRSQKIVGSISQLLDSDSPICHFHSKLMQKEPRVGGAWEWHQDFGYWYKNEFMFPDQMISTMIALTKATKENGCLQVIKGSHKLGRVNHSFAGEQMGADMTMVNNALKTMDLVYVELDAGDALFFHSNILHRSEANLSDEARWSIISSYCSQTNIAYREDHESRQTPVQVVPDNAILEWKSEPMSQNDFLKKEDDPALKETKWEQEA